MTISLLTSKAALSPKLVKSLLVAVAEIARGDAEGSKDVQWSRLSLMALINLIQVVRIYALLLYLSSFASQIAYLNLIS